MFNKVLLAADGSEHSLRAAQKAVAVVKLSENSSIDIVYVIDSSTSKADVLSHYDVSTITEQRKTKLKPIEDMLIENNITYNFHFIHGEAGPSIVKFAQDHKSDLVVIGSRGLNSLQEMVLGSVSHKVAKRANCPVMIVK